jgi:LacI family transcriptional regulator
MTKQFRVAIKLDLVWPLKRHAGIFAGTQKFAEEHGWHSIIDEFAHDTLTQHRDNSPPYDGVIARANRQLVERASKRKVPLVNVWASYPTRDVIPGVFPDFTMSGRLCAEHLLARGFRNFATLSFPKNLGEADTVREFKRLIGEAGFSTNSASVPQNPHKSLVNWQKTERVIEKWMENWSPPIGVYVGREEVGRMVVQACEERGLRVPDDVAIIAGQNEEVLCEHPRPSLTSMELGYERVGYESARLLQQLMEGKQPEHTQILLPPKGLVVRASTDFHAVDDEIVAAALSFISANSHRSIGAPDVARAVSAETRTLQMRFRKVLDRPIATEIRRVRIERAKRELAQSKRRLADIARDVGFGEAMRMYEVFRRELGVTPSEYRKQRQLDDEK